MKIRALLVLMCAAAACGCVERKMMIRSEPEGAPVWVNEAYAGVTPLEHHFSFYGTYGIRVGPIRDAQDRLLFQEAQVRYDAEAPWYETIPIDFFAEVLWPGTLQDVHEVPGIKLPAAPPVAEQIDPAKVQSLLKRGQEFRQKALEPVPDDPAGE